MKKANLIIKFAFFNGVTFWNGVEEMVVAGALGLGKNWVVGPGAWLGGVEGCGLLGYRQLWWEISRMR